MPENPNLVIRPQTGPERVAHHHAADHGRYFSTAGHRDSTRPIRVGTVPIGGGAPVSVQTMTKTDTREVEATVEEIRRAAAAGADLVRLAVPDNARPPSGRSGPEPVRSSPISISTTSSPCARSRPGWTAFA
jgi:hypothetical protein